MTLAVGPDSRCDEVLPAWFFSPRPTIPDKEVVRLTTVDFRDRMAFIALVGDDIIGIARYDRWKERSDAEVAFMVDDDHQGRGVATLLLEYLAVAARESRLTGLTATVLPANAKMFGVFRSAGFQVSSRFEDGVVEVELGIESTDEGAARLAERGRTAGVRSVQRIIDPRSVAVVGVGQERGGLGHEVFRNLLANGFGGPVYPVNGSGGHVASVRAYRSVLDVPDEVDVAVIAVPADQVLGVVRECGRKRVDGMIVLSAGFSEAGEVGAAMERQLVDPARRHGMRLIGPNCMGVVNTDPSINLNATFVPAPPRPGQVAFFSQSGSLGAAILEYVNSLGFGLSTYVAVGNKADVSLNDMLQYWEDDERTEVVLLYLESVGNPRIFHQLAPRVARKKPLVAVSSSFGPEAGADRWPAQATMEALLSQAGVVCVDTVEQLFGTARVLVEQGAPAGPRLAVIANAGGVATRVAATAVTAGLELAELSDGCREQLAASLPDGSQVGNPIDLTYTAGPDEYEYALSRVLAEPTVDAVIVSYAPPMFRPGQEDVARAIQKMSDASPTKPVVATFFDNRSVPAPEGGREVPVFRFPERAALAMANAARYGQWRQTLPGTVPELAGVDLDAVRRIVDDALTAGSGLIADAPVRQLPASAGIDVVGSLVATTADEAAAAAIRVGLPVALKARNRGPGAKSELAGLALDLHRGEDVRDAYRRMEQSLGSDMGGAVVQAMAQPGVDVRLVLQRHERLGSVMVMGAGGVAGRTDTQLPLAVLPLTDAGAADLVGRSSVGDMFSEQQIDTAPLEELVLRLSQLAVNVSEIRELVLDPIIVATGGATVTDASVRVASATADPQPAVRRLS